MGPCSSSWLTLHLRIVVLGRVAPAGDPIGLRRRLRSAPAQAAGAGCLGRAPEQFQHRASRRRSRKPVAQRGRSDVVETSDSARVEGRPGAGSQNDLLAREDDELSASARARNGIRAAFVGGVWVKRTAGVRTILALL